MPETLKLRFNIALHDLLEDGENGPKFDRWLPDGERDAISIRTAHPNFDLKVWFERFGFNFTGRIKFSRTRREVDSDLMSRQSPLDAGPLFGELTVHRVDSSVLQAMREERTDSPEYAAFVNLVVNEIIQPVVGRIVDLLRVNFGQYWIRPLKPWDSREGTFGHYCHQELELSWSVDGVTWRDVIPDPPVAMGTIYLEGVQAFREYLTKEDWESLPSRIQTAPPFTRAGYLLARAHELLEEGNLNHAVVDAATSLEIGLNEEVKRRIPQDISVLKKAADGLLNLPADSIPAILGLLTGAVDQEGAVRIAAIVKLRHEVVHEGHDIPRDKFPVVRQGISEIGRLFGMREKFPSGKGALIDPPKSLPEPTAASPPRSTPPTS